MAGLTWGSFEPNRFDLVKQLDAMRSGQSASQILGDAESKYAPQAQPQADLFPSSPYGGRGGSTTPGQAAGRKVGRLASYGGYQFDEGLVPLVKDIHERFGLRISSGYRTQDQNSRANGVPNSHHLYGGAVDFSGDVKKMQEAAGYAKSLGYHTLLHDAGSGYHLHISY